MLETQVRSLGGKIPWRRACKPLQYSCLENPMDRGAWWATVLMVTKSRTEATGHAVPVSNLCHFDGPSKKWVTVCVMMWRGCRAGSDWLSKGWLQSYGEASKGCIVRGGREGEGDSSTQTGRRCCCLILTLMLQLSVTLASDLVLGRKHCGKWYCGKYLCGWWII